MYDLFHICTPNMKLELPVGYLLGGSALECGSLADTLRPVLLHLKQMLVTA